MRTSSGGELAGVQVKNLALMAYISVGCPSQPIMEFLDEWNVERLEAINPRVVPSSTKAPPAPLSETPD